MPALSLVPSLRCFIGFGLAATCTLAGAERFVASPRSLGMGGTGVASARGNDAQHSNPAVFGFMARRSDNELPDAPSEVAAEMEAAGVEAIDDGPDVDNNDLGGKKFGFGVDANVGIRLYGPIGEILDNIEDIDQFDIASDVTLDPGQAADAVRLLGQLVALDAEGLGFAVNATAGTTVRIWRLGVGARVWGDAAGFITDIDLVNIGLADGTALTDGLSLNADQIIGDVNGQTAATYTPQTLTADQQVQLGVAGFDADAIDAIDALVGEQIAQGTLDQAQVDAAIDTLSTVPVASLLNPNSIDDNTTSVVLRGVGVAEIPVTYGYAFNDKLSIGVTGKFMHGRVYGSTVQVFDDDADDVIEVLDEEYNESTTFGLDIGVMYRVPNFQLGIIGRNLNTPSFDGFTSAVTNRVIADVDIDPSVVAGAAWIPHPTVTLELNADLLAYDDMVRDRELQYLAGGVEWDAFRFLALRAGAYQNIAEDDSDPTLTAGIGINLYLLRLDFAGAYGLDTVEYDGDEFPTNARFSFGLSIDW